LKNTVFVSVPASSGNVGVGFDVLGLALSLRNELTVRVVGKSGAPKFILKGEGADKLPDDATNPVYTTMRWLFRKAGKNLPALEITCLNRIPLARGLGSSSTAYLAALLAANRLLGDKYSEGEILAFATDLEGHPDNVAPALHGGLRASGLIGGKVVSIGLPAPKCALVVAVPAFELSTKKARAVLPPKVRMSDAVFNLSAVALLPHALAKDPALLGGLLVDRLHEPFRAKLIPGFHRVRAAAINAGAYAMTLSGAGPTLLSFVPRGKAARVASAMMRAFAAAGVRSRAMELTVDTRGAIVR
jgi:homoserine kinase